MGTYFLEGSDAVAADNGFGDVVGVLFETANVGGVEGESGWESVVEGWWVGVG